MMDISMASARRSNFAVSGVGARSIGAASSTVGVASFFSGDSERWFFSVSSFSIICDAARISSIMSAWRSLSRAIASNVASPVLPRPTLKLMPASMRLSSSFHSRSVIIISHDLDVDCPSGYSSSRTTIGAGIFFRTLIQSVGGTALSGLIDPGTGSPILGCRRCLLISSSS